MEIHDRKIAPLGAPQRRPSALPSATEGGLPTDSVRWSGTTPRPPMAQPPAGAQPPAQGQATARTQPRPPAADPRAPLFVEDPGVRVGPCDRDCQASLSPRPGAEPFGQGQERPLMLGPIPDEAVLPTDPQKRTRVLLNGMILSAPSPHMRRIVVDQLEAFGPEAVSLVHNFGTRIIVLPKDMKAEEAFKKYHLDDDAAKDLKSDTGGMYLPSSNLLFLREDMLSDGFSARLSAGIARHELAHALDDALGSALDVTALYKDAKDHHHLVTSYAGTNEAEYFAESVTAYLSPEGEFKESFLRSAYIGLSGFEAPQHPLLEKRDPAAARMLDDVFNNKVPNAKAPLHRSKREQDETWLWRAHQLSPSDERIRIALLDRQKARAKDPGEAATLEGRIEAEYRHVEGRLIQTWKADPAQRKHGFALLSHYGERAERVEAGPRKANLDARAAQVVKALAKVDARAGGDSQARWNRAQDYDYLAGQLRMNGLGTASEAAREVADGMMKDSWQRR